MLREIYKGMEIPYTVCFCRYLLEEKILLVKRKKRPNKNKWNGLGGKVDESDENPRKSVEREILEEANIDLNEALSVRFVGFVTWDTTKTDEHYKGGMYVFVADFDKDITFAERDTREGLLAWKDQSWLLDKTNTETVDNEALFLEHMLEINEPVHCHCTYVNGTLVNFEVFPF